jgi:hypothetical protein
MRYGTDSFQVRHGDPALIGEYSLSGTHPLGLGLARHADFGDDSDADNPMATPAGADGAMGVLAKRMDTDGPTLLNNLLGNTADESIKTGGKVPIERYPAGSQIEIESADSKAYNADQPTDPTDGYLLVTSGTGAISASTAVGTLLGYQNGRLRVAQTADRVEWKILAQLTPKTEGNIRLLIEKVEGELKD